jgi:hypothetical protein
MHQRLADRVMTRISVVFLGLVLAGCTVFDKGPQLPCPRAVILSDAAEMKEYRPGPGRDLTDVLYEGEIVGMSSSCEYDDDGYVDSDVVLTVGLARGPAAEGNIGRFAYFVAITNPDDKIIAKQVFPVEVEYPGFGPRVVVQEEISQRIHYAPNADARFYRIFIGFQLTQDQLDYLRRGRGG